MNSASVMAHERAIAPSAELVAGLARAVEELAEAVVAGFGEGEAEELRALGVAAGIEGDEEVIQ